MRKIILVAVTLGVAGCGTIDKSVPPSADAIRVAGHPYWTKADCKRRKPLGKWDGKCDVPVVGFNGFHDDSLVSPQGGMAAGN